MRIEGIHVYPVKSCYRTDLAVTEVQRCGLAGDRRWMLVEPDGTALTQRTVPELTRAHPELAGDRLTVRAPGRPDLGELVVPVGPGEQAQVSVWRDTFKATLAGGAADAWFSALLARPVRLVWHDDPARRPADPRFARPGDRMSLADAFPVLLTSQTSLAALNDLIAQDSDGLEPPVPMTRFRPNLVVAGAPAWAEDGWVGRRLSAGTTVFRVARDCGRCVVTTTDQDSGQRGGQPLRTLARHRRVGQRLLFGVQLIPERPGRIAIGDEVTVLD